MSEARFSTFEQEGVQYVVDENLEWLRDYEDKVHGALEESAQKHSSKNPDFLGVLPFDTEQHPSQRLDVVSARSSEEYDLDTIVATAQDVFPGVIKLIEQIGSEHYRHLFTTVAGDLHQGDSYVFAYTHDRVHNTPLGMIAVRKAIESAADFMKISLPQETYHRLMVGKMLSRVNAKGMPAVPLLSMLGVIDMSFPRTLSAKQLGMDDKVQTGFNASVKEARENPAVTYDDHIEQEVRVVDHMSPSGTTEIVKAVMVKPTRENLYRFRETVAHMAPAGRGTAAMMYGRWVVPIAVTVSETTPNSEVGYRMLPPTEPNDVAQIMRELERLGTAATRTRHKYHATDELYESAVK